MEKRKDRRILRTREILSTTLFELMKEKNYSQISIKEIMSRANIGRSTFYEHFENKEQLLFSRHERLKEIIEHCSKSVSSEKTKLLLTTLFKHIEEYKSLSNTIHNEHSHSLMLERLELIMKDHYITVARKEIINNNQIAL